MNLVWYKKVQSPSITYKKAQNLYIGHYSDNEKKEKKKDTINRVITWGSHMMWKTLHEQEEAS